MDADDKAILAALPDKPVIVLLNKSDLETELSQKDVLSVLAAYGHPADRYRVFPVSALEGKGLSEIEAAITDLLFNGVVSFNNEVYITNTRQLAALQDTQESLQLVLEGIKNHMPEDFLSIDLMAAYDSLGKMIGESVGEDLINEIFGKFCMGK